MKTARAVRPHYSPQSALVAEIAIHFSHRRMHLSWLRQFVETFGSGHNFAPARNRVSTLESSNKSQGLPSSQALLLHAHIDTLRWR